MAGIKIVDLPSLGRDLASTDLFEMSLVGGTGSRKITGQEIMNASKLSVGNTPIVNGAVGQLLFQGAGNVLGESANLFWDNTNGRLGIGGTPSTYNLDVVGTARVQGQITTTTANAQFGAIGASTGEFRIDGVNGGTYAFSVYSSNTLRFGVTGYGGVTSPGGYGINGTNFFIQNRINIGTSNATGAINVQAQSGNADIIILKASSGGDAFTIKNATGNVLINTATDAGFKLDVNGTARVSGQATIQTLTVGLGGGAIASNTAIGLQALNGNTTGVRNVALGQEASKVNSTGVDNTAIGYLALHLNTANHNTAVGSNALYSNTGNHNSGFGRNSLVSNTTGGQNTGIGRDALSANTTANNNTALGYQAGQANTTGANNIFIGQGSTGVSATDSNRTWIGNSSTTSTWLGGNVLIGTTTDAGYKLDVNGTARATQLHAPVINLGGNGNTIINYTSNSINLFAVNAANSDIQIAPGRQVNINNALSYTAQASSILQVDSTTKGFLPPRMTQAQRNAIASPAIGLEIYQTDATEGKYIYKSSGWTYIG